MKHDREPSAKSLRLHRSAIAVLLGVVALLAWRYCVVLQQLDQDEDIIKLVEVWRGNAETRADSAEARARDLETGLSNALSRLQKIENDHVQPKTRRDSLRRMQAEGTPLAP